MLARLLPLIVVAALASCAAPVSTRAPDRMPSARIVGLDARLASVEEIAAGRPALVNFWATWCTSCDRELAALDKLAARAKERGGVVVGVAVGEPRATVAERVRRRGLSYPQLVDEDYSLADALGERRVPTTIVIDKEGKIVRETGALDDATIAAFGALLDR